MLPRIAALLGARDRELEQREGLEQQVLLLSQADDEGLHAGVALGPGHDLLVERGLKRFRQRQTLGDLRRDRVGQLRVLRRDGVVEAILVEDGEPVEFDQPMIVLA